MDEASLLACAAYVDLNPIRAAIAETPEKSDFTGAKDRIDDLKERSQSTFGHATHDWERRSNRRSKSGWISPIEIDETRDPIGADADSSGRRASLKGFLSISLSEYLALLDWTGRQITTDRKGKKKRGKIPSHLAPILGRLGMEQTGWCKLVKSFGKLFKRAAGTEENLKNEASRRGQALMHAPGSREFVEATAG